MKNLNIFLLFPESDDEILAMGEDIEEYMNVIKDLKEVKNKVQYDSYRFFYDSKNISIFCSKAESLCSGLYLHNIRNQLQLLLKGNTTNVVNQPLFKTDCSYFQWNSNTVSPKTDNIIRSATECFIDKTDERTIVISFLCQDVWNRDFVPIIKDAPHYEGLPIMSNIPYFNPVGSFVEWYKVQNSNRQFCLSDVCRFERTKHIRSASKQRIYKEINTNNYWYYDSFHKENKEHYEVFDSNGNHIGEADLKGNIIEGTKDIKKSIKDSVK